MPSDLAKDYDGILFLSGKQLPVPASISASSFSSVFSEIFWLRVKNVR